VALAVASGSFLSATSTGNFAVTGVGFQGKVLLLFGGLHLTGLGTAAGAIASVGMATSSSNRGCCGQYAQDAQSTTNTARTQNITSCYREIAGTTTMIDVDFVSWDADGFTLNLVSANAASLADPSRIFYLVLGGEDLTDAKVGTFDSGTSQSGALAVTGVGFQPDLLMLASSQHSTTSPTTEGNVNGATLALGFSKSSTSRWAFAGAALNASANTTGSGGFNAAAAIMQSSVTTRTAYSSRYDLDSFDADGFTLDKEEQSSATSRGFLYLALTGTFRSALGTFTQKTSTGTQATTGVGFQPLAVLFGSAAKAVNTSVTEDNKIALGVALSASNRRAIAMVDEGSAVEPTQADRYASEAVAIALMESGTPGTVVAAADLDSLDADGFTLDWTTADATAREIGYLALASAEDEEPEPPAACSGPGQSLWTPPWGGATVCFSARFRWIPAGPQGPGRWSSLLW
jgi:hypothetical protein